MVMATWSLWVLIGAVVGMVIVTAWLMSQAREKRVVRAKLFRH